MRWQEEVTLTSYEMQWTVRYFLYMSRKWVLQSSTGYSTGTGTSTSTSTSSTSVRGQLDITPSNSVTSPSLTTSLDNHSTRPIHVKPFPSCFDSYSRRHLRLSAAPPPRWWPHHLSDYKSPLVITRYGLLIILFYRTTFLLFIISAKPVYSIYTSYFHLAGYPFLLGYPC